MTSPMTGPAWYWIAGTTALVLWAWAILGVPLAVLAGRRLRSSRRAAFTKPGRGRLVTVVKTWECHCQQVWRGPGDILHFPCSVHMDTEIKGLSR